PHVGSVGLHRPVEAQEGRAHVLLAPRFFRELGAEVLDQLIMVAVLLLRAGPGVAEELHDGAHHVPRGPLLDEDGHLVIADAARAGRKGPPVCACRAAHGSSSGAPLGARLPLWNRREPTMAASRLSLCTASTTCRFDADASSGNGIVTKSSRSRPSRRTCASI